jgi:hypothetical protein
VVWEFIESFSAHRCRHFGLRCCFCEEERAGDYARLGFGGAGCVCVANGQGGAGRVFEVGFQRVGIGAGDLYLFIRDLQ